MALKAPSFWQKKSTWGGNLLSLLLTPLGWIYGGIVHFRLRWTTPTKVSVPVLCVGNLTLGGTGKTPTVLVFIDLLRELGHVPHILTRGYGGSLKGGIVRVDPDRQGACLVGDEPLLLAQRAPVWRGADRVTAAKMALEAGATVLIMDDGLQNPSLYKDVSLAVFEGISQVGNGRVFPAGPLRQSLSSGLRSVQGVLLLNFQDKAFQEYLERKRQKLSIFHGRIETSAVPTPGRSYVAFAGIGVPQKFFNLLAERGYPLVQTLSFPDHHPYTAQEQDELLTLAQREGAQLVTTEKDAVKLHPSFLDQVDVVEISLTFEDREGVKAWLRGHLQVGV